MNNAKKKEVEKRKVIAIYIDEEKLTDPRNQRPKWNPQKTVKRDDRQSRPL